MLRRLTTSVPSINKLYFAFSVNEEYKIQILNRLKEIKHSNSQKDIVSNGYIENLTIDQDGRVIIDLKLDQDYRKIKALCSDALKQYEWIKNLDIRMAPKKENVFTQTNSQKRGNLQNVNKIIAVSSCKGGVGKSTIALNLTFSLQKLGFKVGIFDADVYGPSLPTLIGKEKQQLYAPEDKPKEILPIEFNGVKTMSYGFASGNQKAIIRGPMVSSIVVQLVQQTQWQNLDYLVVDMPPGTGDIQISLCQELNFDGAVIVTTPQRLSFIDVVKGIEMFDVLKVPTLSVVENMAEYVCPNCNHLHKPFGPGYINMLQKQFGIASALSIPLYGDISKYSDLGSPVVLTLPDDHTINNIYRQLANNVVNELNRTDLTKTPTVRYDTGKRQVIIRDFDGKEKPIKSIELRSKCNCALCVDEFTGKRLNQKQKLDQEVYPYKIEPKGNYAVAIVWSDGHRSSIYPYKRLWSDEIIEHKS
ncbi:unnamed protein product [Paramecium pentaurelia]|uniref:Gamma-butyrobetaine hydroxylase-like N-terminal domain-containing protein n=1 Tax=Paramecium pentaurelia TaxID=43138 RepID=A0A8S1TJM8_9CILI|nr:unnamed protein product [Paramecium pentaurelia]